MRKLLVVLSIFLFVVVGLGSCDFFFKNRFHPGSLPTAPVNLELFNSEFDDYNSALMMTWDSYLLCYSTNRNSSGQNFDFIYYPMEFSFDNRTEVLNVSNEYPQWSQETNNYYLMNDGLKKINSEANELGPYLEVNQKDTLSDFEFLFLYATDATGDFQINFTYNEEGSYFGDSNPVEFLNSDFDDLYPSFNTDYSRIYFCSNREGDDFSIFFVEIGDTGHDLLTELSETNDHPVNLDTVLSSDYDDKCPYIFENTLVFTSNRPGGFGGYDLYYSKFENGSWGVPINMGVEINTDHDEYRPILFHSEIDYSKDMMVFSSNRPGGQGGFDLYYVGFIHDR